MVWAMINKYYKRAAFKIPSSKFLSHLHTKKLLHILHFLDHNETRWSTHLPHLTTCASLSSKEYYAHIANYTFTTVLKPRALLSHPSRYSETLQRFIAGCRFEMKLSPLLRTATQTDTLYKYCQQIHSWNIFIFCFEETRDHWPGKCGLKNLKRWAHRHALMGSVQKLLIPVADTPSSEVNQIGSTEMSKRSDPSDEEGTGVAYSRTGLAVNLQGSRNKLVWLNCLHSYRWNIGQDFCIAR